MQRGRLVRISSLTATFCSSSYSLLKIGDVLTKSRRFTDADVIGYSEVSGDRNPIHLIPDFARKIVGFERGQIVHGLFVASLFPSLIASQFPGAVYASQTLQFKLPVYIQDEVIAEVRATNIRAIKEKYYVKWTTKCYTNKECLVLDAGGEGSLRPEQCGAACDYRCSATSHRKPCLFFCNMCCAKCLCVPSGTYGNKEECPCYNTWKTKEGTPKCP